MDENYRLALVWRSLLFSCTSFFVHACDVLCTMCCDPVRYYRIPYHNTTVYTGSHVRILHRILCVVLNYKRLNPRALPFPVVESDTGVNRRLGVSKSQQRPHRVLNQPYRFEHHAEICQPRGPVWQSINQLSKAAILLQSWRKVNGVTGRCCRSGECRDGMVR